MKFLYLVCILLTGKHAIYYHCLKRVQLMTQVIIMDFLCLAVFPNCTQNYLITGYVNGQKNTVFM